MKRINIVVYGTDSLLKGGSLQIEFKRWLQKEFWQIQKNSDHLQSLFQVDVEFRSVELQQLEVITRNTDDRAVILCLDSMTWAGDIVQKLCGIYQGPGVFPQVPISLVAVTEQELILENAEEDNLEEKRAEPPSCSMTPEEAKQLAGNYKLLGPYCGTDKLKMLRIAFDEAVVPHIRVAPPMALAAKFAEKLQARYDELKNELDGAKRSCWGGLFAQKSVKEEKMAILTSMKGLLMNIGDNPSYKDIESVLFSDEEKLKKLFKGLLGSRTADLFSKLKQELRREMKIAQTADKPSAGEMTSMAAGFQR